MKQLIGLVCLFLALTLAPALAQTNIDYWVQPLNVSLTGSTNGVLITNGIVARVKTASVKLAAKDIIQLLNNKPAFQLSTLVVTNISIETNVVHKTNLYITNIIVSATPLFTLVSNPVYSASAKLMLKTFLGTKISAPPLVIIRDTGPADYVISNYFSLQTVAFNGNPQNILTSGKFDIVHELEDAMELSVRQFIFNSQGFDHFPPAEVYFDVQGATTDHVAPVIEDGVAIDGGVSQGFNASAAGTGQLGNPPVFAVFRGSVSTSRGKHEVE